MNLREQLQEQLKKGDLWALDIETTCAIETCNKGADCEHALFPNTSKITWIAIYNGIVGHTFTDSEHFINLLRSEPFQRYRFFGHGFDFDCKQLKYRYPQLDIDRFWTHDTQYMAHIYAEKVPPDWLEAYSEERVKRNKTAGKSIHRNAKGLSLKTLAPYFLQVDPFWEVEGHNEEQYVLKDVTYSYQLFEHLLSNMTDDELNFYASYAMPWAKMLFNAEYRGIKLNQTRLQELQADLEAKESAFKTELDTAWSVAHKKWREIKEKELIGRYEKMAEAAIYKNPDRQDQIIERYTKLANTSAAKLPDRINYDSDTQMAWLLRDYLGLDIRNYVGKESTGKSVLVSLDRQGHKSVGIYNQWRKAQKLLTAFLPSYRAFSAHDGNIHCDFNMTGTKTGRLSSSNPNLQQVSKILKPLFVARPGYKFLGHDQAAIEARLIAWYSEDPELFTMISKGQSVHDVNAKTFFNLQCSVEAVKHEFSRERQAAKKVGFTLFYGAGWNRIKEAFLECGFVITDAEAKQMHKRFKEFYWRSFEFHREVTERFENGEVILNAIGRPIVIQPWENPYMQGYNRLVQSSASDLLLHGVKEATAKWIKNGIDCHPLLFVHDFVLAEAKEEQAVEADVILVQELTKLELTTAQGTIKLEVDGGISDDWR